jgi:outer membrane protein
MSTRLLSAALIACGLASLPGTAMAQTTPGVAPGTDLIIELGVGGRVSPSFEGSSEYEVTPFPIIRPRYFNIPGLGEFGGRDGTGFSISPSFGYTGERKGEDFDEVIGLRDVSATYEAGLKAAYGWTHAEIYGEARYAFGGAHGLVGEIGANAIARPSARLEVKAGPFVSFAGDDYMDTYFSVTPAESLNTGGRLSAYEADGGIKSAGINASVRYEFKPDWFVNAEASYSRLVSDAKDSPIVRAGSENQFTVGLGVSRRFTLDLF